MKLSYVQSSFLSGVLDPRASGRIETDAYQQGLLQGDNVVPSHLGGLKRRGGLRYIATLPMQLLKLSPIAITTPRGGTGANANDSDEDTVVLTTTNVGTIDPYVVVQYDFGAAYEMAFADAVGLFSGGGSSTHFGIQYSLDNVSWTTWGNLFALIDPTIRSYRRVGPITGRYFRVVKLDGIDMGAVKITLAEFNFWQEAAISDAKIFDFQISTEERYAVVLTDRSASIFENGTYVGSLPTPYHSADLKDIDAATNAETMVLVHEDYAPRFILREDTSNFQIQRIIFDAIPVFDFGDALSSSTVPDIQTIIFSGGWIQGDTFQVELDNARSAAVVFSNDADADGRSTLESTLTRAIQGLYTVKGFTGVSVTRTGAFTYQVTFADASASDYALMSIVPVVTKNGGVGSVIKDQDGASREEPVWSKVRGYPRTVVFFEGRMYFGGTKALLESLFGSEVNNILNFEIREGLADEAIFITLSGQQLNAIQGLFAGRSLQLFTSGGEFRYIKPQATPIVPGDAPVNQTQYGAAKVRPVTIDGATIFVQRTRKAIRDFRYAYQEDAFDSLGVSALAPHLINGVTDLAAWNGSSIDEIGLVFVCNTNGTISVFNSRKEAQVQAWARWTTRGFFKAVGVVLEDVYFAVQHNDLTGINGLGVLTLEMIDPNYYTDCAAKIINDPATTSITGLAHLNGVECRVRADDFILENITPVAGAATIQRASLITEVGLNFNPLVTPMPLNNYSPKGPNFLSKRRIVNVRAKVLNTLGLYVNGRPYITRRYDVDHFDTPAEPYSGNLEIEETSNWDNSEDKLIDFTQVDPLPFELLAYEVILESNP